MDEVARSIRVSSTVLRPITALVDEIGFTLAGFVAGEGSFIITTKTPFKDGSPRLRFVFEVNVARRDRQMLEGLRSFLGFGSITDQLPKRPGYQPTSQFRVASLKAHHAATIPFADRYLLPSAKRQQFDLWRQAMSSYEALRPTRYGKGRSPCRVPGCGKPVRGRMLCRSHYYRATGY